jgi:hypothetical protein
MTATESAAAAASWAAQLKELKTLFPAVRDTILFCFHALTQDPEVEFEDLKERASQNGLRITNASVNGAKRLLANSGESQARAPAANEDAEPAAPARARRPRPAQGALDAEALIRGLAGKLQAHGAVEANDLRDAMRRAIRILIDAVGD